MAFEWTAHRFSGGALAFDLANTIILRHDAEKRRDRLVGPDDARRFAAAAAMWCAERPAIGSKDFLSDGDFPLLLALREAIDEHFRRVANGNGDRRTLAALLRAVASGLESSSALVERAAHSALRLATGATRGRIGLCGNCGWLILDTSRNASRVWCDMAVCGNRQKARRHYLRKKESLS